MPLDFKSLWRAQDGKAIPNHPALTRDEPATIYSPGAASVRAQLSQREATRHLQAYGGKKDAIDWVMDCVRLYADAASTAPWYLKKDDQKLYRKKTDIVPDEASVGPQPLYDLLEQPNPYQPYSELIDLLLIDLLLVGNAYWLKWRMNDQGQPLALYRLAPPYIKVVPGAYGVEKYVYQVPGNPTTLKLDPLEVTHFKLANPHSAYLGLGVIQGGGRPLDLELSLTDTQASYYERHATPSMIVQSERRVPSDVFKKLRSQLRARYGGPRNAGELMVLEAGLKATSLSPSAVDAAFEPLARASRDRTLAMFRVPPRLLGISDQNVGSDKLADIQRVFDNKAIKPLLKKLQTKISLDVTRAWGVDFVIDYKYAMPLEDQVKLAGDFASIPGVTVREVRAWLDLEPTGDPNIDDLVLNLPGDNGKPGDTRNGIPDRPLPGEPGRPPKSENTAAFGVVGGGNRPDLVAGAQARRPSEKKSLEDALARLTAIEGKAVELKPQASLPAPTPPTDLLESARTSEVDSLASSIAGGLQDAAHVLERSLLDHLEGKAFNATTLRARLRNSAAWATFKSMVDDVLKSAAERGLSVAAVQSAKTGLRSEKEIDYEALAAKLVGPSVKSIQTTLRDQIVTKVGDAVDGTATPGEIEQIIRDAVTSWRTDKLDGIAITEAVKSYNEGTLAVAEGAGSKEVYVTDGTDTDEPCIEANGQTWTIEKARANLLEHPRCRRAFIPVTE